MATAGNTPLHVDGFAETEFMLGGLRLTYKFYVVRNIILGLDGFKSRGVLVYYDLSCIRVHDTYVPLVDDVHVASVVRVNVKVYISPQAAHICYVQVRKHPIFPTDELYMITRKEPAR